MSGEMFENFVDYYANKYCSLIWPEQPEQGHMHISRCAKNSFALTCAFAEAK